MHTVPIFRDRYEAGRALVASVRKTASEGTILVLALPRGGVPVAFEVAQALPAALDVFWVRKLGLPGREELAIGAIASGGIRVLNRTLIRNLELSSELVEGVTTREGRELERREANYREGRQRVQIEDRTVILIDDGLATGATALAATKAVRLRGPRRLVVAVPVASRSACDELRGGVDEVICLATPEPFDSVGQWYEDFSQTSDEEVRELLRRTTASWLG